MAAKFPYKVGGFGDNNGVEAGTSGQVAVGRGGLCT